MFVGVVVENFHKCQERQEKEDKEKRELARLEKLERKWKSKNLRADKIVCNVKVAILFVSAICSLTHIKLLSERFK